MKNDNESNETTRTWARPQAIRRDQNLGAWMIFLSLICAGVACWGLFDRLYWKVRHRAAARRAARVERSASSFVAISYDGVTTTPEPNGEYIASDMFEEHLEALIYAGYHPITLADVRSFYEENRPLPSKAILLTFENSRRSTFFTTRNILEHLDWRAVMGVVTGDVNDKTESVILAPYLRDMISGVVWDLACESDRGAREIPTGSDGSRAMFFSSPQWIADHDRFETLDEFDSRIRADHTAALAAFDKTLHFRPDTFFFPKGNYGQYEPLNGMLREKNLQAVADNYKLGFAFDDFGYNDARSDRRRLNRIRVNPTWDAQQLVKFLDGVWPRALPGGWDAATDIGQIRPDSWRPVWGECVPEGATVRLCARPPDDVALSDTGATSGAKAWLAGSNGFVDGTFELRFRLQAGGFTMYLHYAAEDDAVALTLGEDGVAVIVRHRPGRAPERLAAEPLDIPRAPDRVRTLTAVSRNGVLFTLFDGRLLFGGGVSLGADPPRAGFVGAGVWGSTPGTASADIVSARLRARLPRFALWEAEAARNKADVFAELERQAFRYDAVAPPWLAASDGTAGFQLAEDATAIQLAAAKVFCGVWPAIRFSGHDPFATMPRETVAEAFKDGGFDGLFVNARDLENDSLSKLRDWILEFREMCGSPQLPVALKLPPSFIASPLASGFLDSIPGAVVAAPDGAQLAPSLRSRVHGILYVVNPDTASNEAYYRLAAFNEHPEASQPGDADFVVKAERALSDLRFTEADAFADQWTKVCATSADAWEYLARLRVRESREGEAVDAYRKTLELDSARVPVAIAFADYLLSISRAEEARDLLDTYARAFPLNREIALAQARWLDARGMRPEARAILRDWVSRQPENIDLRVTLHTYLQTPSDRYGNIRDIISLVAPSQQNLLWFRRKVETSGLLTFQESSVAFDFIRDTVRNSRNAVVQRNYAQLLPLEDPVVERFADGHLSSAWELTGSCGDTVPGEFLLPGLPDPAEAHLRLLKSDLLRDGYIETTIGESLGAFWLYARRSTLGMVRFGFDSDGFLRIQVWQNGEPHALDSVLWTRPKTDITLRLEIRGDGAIGYFNGREVFSTPLQIPRELGYGWWGIASSASETGMAQTRVKTLSAGPLGSAIAVVDPLAGHSADDADPDAAASAAAMRDLLERLRPYVRKFSALSPLASCQQPDGALPPASSEALSLARVFASYNRLRFMPVASLDYVPEPEPSTLIDFMKDLRVDALCLRVRRMPSKDWIRRMEAELEKTFANIVIIRSEAPLENAPDGQNTLEIHEIQRGNLLLHPVRVPWEIRSQCFKRWEERLQNGTSYAQGCEPAVVVVSRREVLPPLQPPPEPKERKRR